MVEGASRARNDRSGNRINIPQYLGRRNPYYPVPVLLQKFITHFVPIRTITSIVRLAIDLDNQGRFATIKIHDIWPDRMLTAKLHLSVPATQPLPQQNLRQAHIPPKPAGGRNLRTKHVRHAPSTATRSPSPYRGGFWRSAPIGVGMKVILSSTLLKKAFSFRYV